MDKPLAQKSGSPCGCKQFLASGKAARNMLLLIEIARTQSASWLPAYGCSQLWILISFDRIWRFSWYPCPSPARSGCFPCRNSPNSALRRVKTCANGGGIQNGKRWIHFSGCYMFSIYQIKHCKHALYVYQVLGHRLKLELEICFTTDVCIQPHFHPPKCRRETWRKWHPAQTAARWGWWPLLWHGSYRRPTGLAAHVSPATRLYDAPSGNSKTHPIPSSQIFRRQFRRFNPHFGLIKHPPVGLVNCKSLVKLNLNACEVFDGRLPKLFAEPHCFGKKEALCGEFQPNFGCCISLLFTSLDSVVKSKCKLNVTNKISSKSI